MSTPRTLLLVLGLAATAAAQNSVAISIGVRETEIGGGTFTSIGQPGGTGGGIEWINLDGQNLVLDGSWQQFTFTLATDPVTGFAGSSQNGILEGNFGVLEHIRILNNNGIVDPLTIWIDDITNTTSAGATNFGDFQGFMQGDEVIFQEPGFSGSTSGNIAAGGTAGVDNFVASRSASYLVDFQFVDNTPTRWLRLTSFATTQPGGNPLVRFDQNSVITFWMRGGKCQENLGGNGPGDVVAEMCGTGLTATDASIFYVGGAQIGALGAFALSSPGAPDLSLFGGTFVSGAGNFVTAPIFADVNGQFSLPIAGTAALFDIVAQCAFFDTNLPQGIAFSNAILMRFGQ